MAPVGSRAGSTSVQGVDADGVTHGAQRRQHAANFGASASGQADAFEEQAEREAGEQPAAGSTGARGGCRCAAELGARACGCGSRAATGVAERAKFALPSTCRLQA